MNYADLLEGRERFGWRLGLSRMARLLARLDHPERAFSTLAVAGSNGKGSTARILSALLSGEGRPVGLYTSPHLGDFRERIALDGDPLPPAGMQSLMEDLLPVLEGWTEDPPTQFEVLTAAALVAFRQAGVGRAILEAGLGGRLDATNLPSCQEGAILTRVDLEHTELLGSSLAAIGREKAALLRPGSVWVTGDLPPAALEVVEGRAEEAGAWYRWGRDFGVSAPEAVPGGTRFTLETTSGDLPDLFVPLSGRHQAHNAALALVMARALLPDLEASALRRRLAAVRWPGRLERIGAVLLDAAHNPAGAAALATALRDTLPEGRVTLVLGILRDKDAAGILSPLLPLASRLVLTRPPAERGLPARLLAAVVPPGTPITVEEDWQRALEVARREPAPLVVAGSFYLVGPVRQVLLGEGQG